MLGTTKYKFRLARAPSDTREMGMSFESTWDVIHRSICAGFSGKMSGSIRFMTVVKAISGEVVGEKITDAGKFWLAMVKWYDSDTTVFEIADDSPVDIELQLQSTQSLVVKARTPFMGTYEEIISLVRQHYSYLEADAIKSFCPVRAGSLVDMSFTTADQFWDWFVAIAPTKEPARFIIAVPSMAKLDVSASTISDKFSVFVPKDCSIELLKTIILQTVLQLKGAKMDVESIAVRSLRGSEDLVTAAQLKSLFNVSTSWLFVALRSTGPSSAVAAKSAAPAGPTHFVRFCVGGKRSAWCAAELAQGTTFEEIKATVAGLLDNVTPEDIKNFVLLDKDGDEFSSGLDTVTKFWRIAVKYFKDRNNRDFIFNIVLNQRSSTAGKPGIKEQAPAPQTASPLTAEALGSSLPSPPPGQKNETPMLPSGDTKPSAGSTGSPGATETPTPGSEALRSESASSNAGSQPGVSAMSAGIPRTASADRVGATAASSAHGSPSAAAAGLPVPPATVAKEPSPEKSTKSRAEAVKPTVSNGYAINFKLTERAQKSVMPSRRLELLRKKEQNGGESGGDNDLYTTTLPYGCSWSAVLEAVCKATGIQSSGDISHLIPLVNGAVVTDKSGDQILVVDRFQFWATVKRSNNANESLVWEVYVTGKGYGQPSQQPAKAVKGLAKEKPSSPLTSSEPRSVVVSVALASQLRLVKPAMVPTGAPWDELVAIVCEALFVNTDNYSLSHFIVFDKDGDQLTTEITTASKFWKISAFNSTILRVYVVEKNPPAEKADSLRMDSPLSVGASVGIDGSQHGVMSAGSAGLSSRPSGSSAPVHVAQGSSELISVSIAHARHPRREVAALLRVNSSWTAITKVFAEALLLDPDMSIAYIIVFDREDRKFGSPIVASDKFWKNISYYSHHVLRLYTVAAASQGSFEGTNMYNAALSSEPTNYKTIMYETIPTMDDIRKAVSAQFKICADIIIHVVFIDSDGDELSGALNADSKLLKFFHHKEVNVRVFTSVPAVTILPRYTFQLEAANGPALKNLKVVSISRTPSWDELRLEIAEAMGLERAEQINHVVFADDEGDELSGNVNNDIKVSKFASSAGHNENVHLRVFLDMTDKVEKADNFFALIADEDISELEKLANSKLNVDRPNPSNSLSAFLWCCESGKLESLRWLMQKKANINQRSPSGSNGLHIAIEHCRDETVDFLVAMGISVFEADGAQLTPFLLACSVGNVHAAKLLLRRGAKTTDEQRSTGYIGIHLAVVNGHIDMLRFLIEENAVSTEAADKKGRTPFLVACTSGRIDVAEWLVEKGCNTRAITAPSGQEGGSSALHLACKNGLLDIVVFLLDLGLNTDLKDARGACPVQKAKEYNHMDIANLILDREIQGAGTLDVALFFRLLELREGGRARTYLENFMKDSGFKYSEDDKVLLFHLASACGHMYIVEYFVMVGCDVNSTLGAVQATPLMQACRYGHVEVVKYLLDHGADFSIKDRTGTNPLQVAIHCGHAEVAACVDDAAKIKRENAQKELKSKVEAVVTPAQKPEIQSSKFGMLFACISGMDANPTASQLFAPPLDDDIESAYDSESDDECGLGESESRHNRAGGTPTGSSLRELDASKSEPAAFALHSACRNGSSLGLVEVLAGLMVDGLDVLDDEGYSSLYIACALGHWDIALHLIERGADVSLLCDRVGETPLHIICHFNVIEVLRKILELRAQRRALADVNLNKIVDVNENSILHVAVLGGAIDVVLLLADETEINLDGLSAGNRTPLHLACINKLPDIAIELIKRDVDIFLRDAAGGSPLLYAVKCNEFGLVQELVMHGADVTDKTETRNTAMHIVCQVGNLEMAIFLYEHGASLLDRNEQGLSPYSYAVKLEHGRLMHWIASVDRKATL